VSKHRRASIRRRRVRHRAPTFPRLSPGVKGRSITTGLGLIPAEGLTFALSLLILIAAVVRVSAARNLSLHVDETSTILAAKQIADHGYPVLPSGAIYLQGALYSYMIAPLEWLGVSPVDDLVLFRLPSVIAGVAAVYLLFRFCRTILGRADAAIFAAALLALDPLSIRWSGLARMYSLLQALSLAVVWLYFRLLMRPRGSLSSASLVVVFFAGVFTHLAVCLFLPPMFLGAWLQYRRRLLSDRRDIAVNLLLCCLAPGSLIALNRLEPPPGEPLTADAARFAFVGDYLLSLGHILRPDFGAWIAGFRDLPLPELMPFLLIAGTGYLAAKYSSVRRTAAAGLSRADIVRTTVILYWLPVLMVAATAVDGEDRYLLHVHPLGFVILALLLLDLLDPIRREVQTLGRVRPYSSSTSSTPVPRKQRGRESGPEYLLITRHPTEPGKLQTRSRLVSVASLVPVLVVAAAVRFPLLNRLSLWLDEGFTVLYSQLSWSSVLGFNGYYSPHPPLYFMVVKAASLFVPETTAGRGISALASIGTIPVVFALASRLLGRRAAVMASLAMALSPVHVYYSQEARMYAPVVFLVALSYLALVSLATAVTWRWAAIYGFSVAIALYTDYSAAFAIAPQILVIAYVIDRHRRGAVPLLVSLCIAGLAYLPWLPIVFDSVRAANQVERREAYLGNEPTRVTDAILALVGLAGSGNYVQSTRDLPWDAAPQLRPIFFLIIAGSCALGSYVLAKQPLAALVVAGALGTVPVALWVSEISPAFAERTVLSATIGWALLVGICGSGSIAGGLGKVGIGAALAGLLVSAVSVAVVDSSATKQRWEDAVHDLSIAERSGIPVVTYSYGHVADTFLDLYAPDLAKRIDVISIRDGQMEQVLSSGLLPDRGMTFEEATSGMIGTSLRRSGQLSPYVWVLYYTRPGSDDVLTAIRSLGYERVRYGEYWTPRYRVYLDLFSLPSADTGSLVAINGIFADSGAGWVFPPWGTRIVPNGQASGLVITGDGEAGHIASVEHPAQAGVFNVSLDVRSAGDPRGVHIVLACTDRSGDVIAQSVVHPDDQDWGDPDQWIRSRVAVVCPSGTATIRLELGFTAVGEAEFRGVRLTVTD
jgi:4-amino-4-deoxy-L-arabinose transferase-like glycosyltransferase